MGMVFDIQRFCLHDGRGIRSVVFLKGCPLKCAWCANPESQNGFAEVMYNNALCHGCRRCVSACPSGAICAGAEGMQIIRSKCDACGLCAEACPWKAIKVCGREATTDEVLKSVCRDIPYYDISHGGVTFSGGEPAYQRHFLCELLEKCRILGIHTAVETSGACESEAFGTIMKLCDDVLFDIKLLSPSEHMTFTGQDNNEILKNLKSAAFLANVTIRVPLIASVNMNDSFCIALGALADSLPVQGIQLMPYHRLGSGKYAQLDRQYLMPSELPPDKQSLAHALFVISSHTKKPVSIVSS